MPGGNQNYKWPQWGWDSAGQIYEIEFSKYNTMQEYQRLHHGNLYNWQTKYNLSVVEGCIKGLWRTDYERQARTEKEGSWISVHGRGSYVSLIPHICGVPNQTTSGMFLGYTRYLSVRTCKKGFWCDEIFSGLYSFPVVAAVDLYSVHLPLNKFQCNLTFSPATV